MNFDFGEIREIVPKIAEEVEIDVEDENKIIEEKKEDEKRDNL